MLDPNPVLAFELIASLQIIIGPFDDGRLPKNIIGSPDSNHSKVLILIDDQSNEIHFCLVPLPHCFLTARHCCTDHAGLSSSGRSPGARSFDELVACISLANILDLGSELLHLHGHATPVK
uniref:Uncharacterized protein n=1 Tax=Arundo donax TaxID=35708 RepID=A0A0A9HFW5_ARUDO